MIPRIEEKIELQLLEKFKDRLQSDAEKKEVTQAYFQRKDNLAKMAEASDMGVQEARPEQDMLLGSDIVRVIQNVEGDGLRFHTYEDIGRYTVFSEGHFKRMFPSKAFGNYEKDEIHWNNTYGIMTREEGLRITNDLARLTLPHERQIDYTAIMGYDNAQIKEEILQDEQKFIAIQ